MAKPIVDLHCHPALKPYSNEAIGDMWKYHENKKAKDLFKDISFRKLLVGGIVKNMATFTQSNLDNCFKGSNRLVFIAVYPPERPFMRPRRPFDHKLTWVQRTLLRWIFGKKLKKHVDTKIIQMLTGFSEETARRYLDEIHDREHTYIDYFNKDYVEEYCYIKDGHLTSSTSPDFTIKPKFRLVRDFSEYLDHKDSKEVLGVITAEGMHALGKYNRQDLFNAVSIDGLSPSNRKDLEDSFVNNIKRLKDPSEFEYPPFFITFSHHFNNLISGHAKSFADAKNGIVPGFKDVFDQRLGMDLGITDFGKGLIKNHLLSRDNGKRILIDTKHMSLNTRDDFIEIINGLKAQGDRVPIICSHTAVNGISTRQKARAFPDLNAYDKKSYVSRWDVNLTDQDIIEIFDSDGVIGVCMHDGRMPGGKFKKLLKENSKKLVSDERVKRLHAQMFLTNVFHIVKVNLAHIRALNSQGLGPEIHEKEAWKTVCLGTDNDGIVDPFDHYSTADKLDDFKWRIGQALKLNNADHMKETRVISLPAEVPFTNDEMSDMMMGHTPEDISDLIFSDNMMQFMGKYFTKAYLSGN